MSVVTRQGVVDGDCVVHARPSDQPAPSGLDWVAITVLAALTVMLAALAANL